MMNDTKLDDIVITAPLSFSNITFGSFYKNTNHSVGYA